MPKNETGPLSYTIQKNKFKMDEISKCETENHQNPKEHEQQPLWPRPEKLLTRPISRGKGNKYKQKWTFGTSSR